MKRFLLIISTCIFFSLQAVGQAEMTDPETYRKHPELGKLKPRGTAIGKSEELVHLRTEYTRTFHNQDGSRTTASSSTPLHYVDESGLWHSLDYRLTLSPERDDLWEIPAKKPRFSYEVTAGKAIWHDKSGAAILSASGRSMQVLNADGAMITGHFAEADLGAMLTEERSMTFTEVYPLADLNYEFGKQYIKSAYTFAAAPALPADAHEILFEETIIVPAGYTLAPVDGSGEGRHETLALRNAAGVVKAILEQPVYSDNSTAPPAPVTINGVTRPGHSAQETDRDAAAASGHYRLTEVNAGEYRLSIAVPATWLSPERTYPVVIDPVAVLMDDSPMPTCYFPQYAQDMLSIEVPEGDTIIHTYLEWDFQAVQGTSAWMADQRSYVSGPNGATQVYQGGNNQAGTQTYSTYTSMANGISTGSLDFTWYAARVWGGNGCNTNFNLITERYIEVTHFDEIFVGEGLVVINEYTASNRFQLDPFGNYEDMVELYNTSEFFLDLGGYYLSDNPNNPTKWLIPSVLIPPFGHLTIVCSGRDSLINGVPHASFRLSQLKPEHILLSNPEGTVLELYPLWVTQNGHSYGRVSDGAEEWGVSASPTLGASNTGHFAGYTSKPVLSAEAGYYSGPVTVEITTSLPEEVVHYTLNGHEPTAEDPVYDGPIVIASTSVLRARAFDPNGEKLPGFMETNTYFISDESTLPVFSFSGDQLNTLFGGTQIEPYGAVEFFNADGLLIDESYCEFDKHGNDSWQYGQRGVDFVSRDEYGYNDELSHPFFPTKDRGDFQRLMVKAAANDNYPFEEGGAHIRDSYIQSVSQLADLELDERSSLNCLVYVNGEYWGVYDLREKVDDKDFTEYYYNQERKYKGSEEYVQFIKTWGSTQAKYGEQRAINDWSEIRNFVLNNNMGDSANFQYVEETLDLQSVVDHFVANSFIVSRDWLNYNTGWWRGLDPTGEARKWKYIMWDMEAAFGHFTNWTGLQNPTVTAPPCQVENLTVGNGHAQMLKKLIEENPTMRHKYVTRYADLLNTKFSCDNLIYILDSMVTNIAPEMPRQIERWGGSVEEWESNVDDLRDWIIERCEVVKDGLIDCYNLTGPYNVTFKTEPPMTGKIKMNSEWLPHYPFEAFVYGNIETILEPQGNGPYQFSHWEIEGQDFESLEDSVRIQLLLTDSAMVTAYFSNPNLGDGELIHYWHFNSLDTEQGDVTTIDADFSLLAEAEPKMTYTGSGPRDMDHFNNGSELNLNLIEGAGRAVRVRNPSAGRSLDFHMPSDGFGHLVFRYAVQRSGQGMLQNLVGYSTDGVNFTSSGLSASSFTVTEDYELITIDFSAIEEVNSNPNFKVRIVFVGNTNQDNGNNRFDNVSLTGIPWVLSTDNVAAMQHVSVFPNPSRSQLSISADFRFSTFRITDVSGRVVSTGSTGGTEFHTTDVSGLAPGVYILHLSDGDRNAVTKFAVQ